MSSLLLVAQQQGSTSWISVLVGAAFIIGILLFIGAFVRDFWCWFLGILEVQQRLHGIQAELHNVKSLLQEIDSKLEEIQKCKS